MTPSCCRERSPEARLARAGTEREKDYLRAVEVLYGKGTKEERDLLYADAMAALHARYPLTTGAPGPRRRPGGR